MRLGTIVGALSFGAVVIAPALAEASSHREAPFISKNPKDDGTDFYAFESYEAGHTGMVTMIANYQPFQDAFAGPNYFGMDTNGLYEIMIDYDGDGVEDLTFQFQFTTILATNNPGVMGFSLHIGPPDGGATNSVPFYNVGLIPNGANTGSSPALNVVETYTVGLVRGPRRAGSAALLNNPGPGGGTTFDKPADNVGAKSFDVTGDPLGVGASPVPVGTPSGYAAYAQNFVYSGVTIPGCSAMDATSAQIFVGQRAESFAANIGPIFDLIDAPATVVTNGGVAAGGYAAVHPNPIGNKNITSIAIELPRDCITQSPTQPVIGAWTTASVRQARVLNPAATYVEPSLEGGAWTQISRLGNPLVNEVVIGLADKDKFNGSAPADDLVNFANYVEFPTLPAVIDIIFGTDYQPTVFPRTDLVAAFLTGLAPINAFPTPDGGTVVPAEYIHLNTNTEALVEQLLDAAVVTPTPYTVPGTGAQTQSRFGAALCVVGGVVTPTNPGCDPFGFPNGRRPIDDVVDLALDVTEGYLLKSGNPAYQGSSPVFFTDGVDQAATVFSSTFPYLTTPTQGANGDGT